MKTTPLFDLMCVLNAESIKMSKQYHAAIDRFARNAAKHSPDKAVEILSAAKKMTDATTLVHEEARRVLENGGKALSEDTGLLQLFVGSMLGNLSDMPSQVLGAASLRGHYLGWDAVRRLYQRADQELVGVLINLDTRSEPAPKTNPKAA